MKIRGCNQNPMWRNNSLCAWYIYIYIIHCFHKFNGLCWLDCFKAYDANCQWVEMWNRLIIHQAMARLIVRSHEDSKQWDFKCCHGCVSEIWQTLQPKHLSNSWASEELHQVQGFRTRYCENGTSLLLQIRLQKRNTHSKVWPYPSVYIPSNL